jgi:hypothetical protein
MKRQEPKAPFPVGGSHSFTTGGRGSWMKMPSIRQQPAEQRPPTPAVPISLHKQMACPE